VRWTRCHVDEFATVFVLGNGRLAPGAAVLTKPIQIETMAVRMRSMAEAQPGAERGRPG
jgi:hypothetical protein